jgi:hypothetical protein
LGDALSPDWEVIRHCRVRDVDVEANPNLPTASASAFELRPNEPYLSVNCPNVFAALPDRTARLQRILKDLRTKPDVREVKSSHWFAGLSVRDIMGIICQSTGERFRVELEQEPGDDSHSGIYGQSGATDDEERMALQTALAASFNGAAVRVSDLERV